MTSSGTEPEDLSILLPSAKIKINQSKGEEFDYIVSVEIVKMSAVLDDKVELVAWYTIKDKKGKIITQQKFADTVNIGKTYDKVAVGYSQLLAELSQEIAGILVESK